MGEFKREAISHHCSHHWKVFPFRDPLWLERLRQGAKTNTFYFNVVERHLTLNAALHCHALVSLAVLLFFVKLSMVARAHLLTSTIYPPFIFFGCLSFRQMQ